MWIEIQIMTQGNTLNWAELGLEVKHEFTRRMVRIEDIEYLQELVNDIQLLHFYKEKSVFIHGDYASIRDQILHLTDEQNTDY
jgi:hypothetical protein